MDLLEKALNLTTLEEMFLERPRATLNLLREDGMRDMFVATGDWEVDRYRVVLDGCVSSENLLLEDPIRGEQAREAWQAALADYIALSYAARNVRKEREKQGLPQLFASVSS